MQGKEYKLMLSKENCLKKRKDFDNVFKGGKTIAGELIFLKVIKNNLDISRLGFVIGLKISKKAVIRNKIKRQLRGIIKENLSDIKPGLDVIIISKPDIIDKNYQEIKNDLEKLLKIL
jgi:ribonuclease P protein component